MTQETTGNWEKELEQHIRFCFGGEYGDTPEEAINMVTLFVHHQLQKAREEERERIRKEFPDYAHTRYLGCSNENGRWYYSYDTEVVYLMEDYFNTPTTSKSGSQEHSTTPFTDAAIALADRMTKVDTNDVRIIGSQE